MPGDNVNRDIMMDFEEDIFKAKRAVVVAIIFIVLLAAIGGLVIFLQSWLYSQTHEEPIQADTEFADSFVIATFNTPVKIDVSRTYPVDICLTDRDSYDNAATTSDAFKYPIASIEDSTEFHYEGDLDPGEYVILLTHAQHDDIVTIELEILVLKPIFLPILGVLGVIIIILIIVVIFKVRRQGKIKKEREEYLKKAAQKPAPSKFGWGQDRGPPPGEAPIYETAYRPPQQPSYSQSDLNYFSDAGGMDQSSSSGSFGSSASSGTSGSSGLHFTPPPGKSSANQRPPRKPQRGEISTGRPPRPAFKKKDRYGFKDRGGGQRGAAAGGRGGGGRERGGKEKYYSKKDKAASRMEKPSPARSRDRPKKRDKEDGYLDFDDF